MSTDTLGRLEPVDLREVWASESRSFTPWLAQEENLAVLGETLGIRLELEAQEKSIGRFRADILCRDTETEDLVVIENQLERTDHKHLGQLLTYASGHQAVTTIIWIAEYFSDEHRSALDWLNKITDDRFRFFGLKIELWRIEESRAAPRFAIVSEPNDWSRALTQATKANNANNRDLLRLDYWTKFQDILNKTGGSVAGKKPRARTSMTYPIGRSAIRLEVKMLSKDAKIRAGLYIRRNAKAYMSLLEAQKDEIEKEMGYLLEYEPVPGSQHSRIAVYLDDADVEDQADWERQHKWLAEKLSDLHRVFAGRISKLDPGDWDEDEIDESL